MYSDDQPTITSDGPLHDTYTTYNITSQLICSIIVGNTHNTHDDVRTTTLSDDVAGTPIVNLNSPSTPMLTCAALR